MLARRRPATSWFRALFSQTGRRAFAQRLIPRWPCRRTTRLRGWPKASPFEPPVRLAEDATEGTDDDRQRDPDAPAADSGRLAVHLRCAGRHQARRAAHSFGGGTAAARAGQKRAPPTWTPS